MHLFYKKTPRLYAITTVQCQQQLDDCCDETKEVVVEFYDDEDFFFSLVQCMFERKNCDNYDTGGKNVVNKKCFAVLF